MGRQRRERIKVVKVGFPVPPPGGLAELKSRIEQAITPRTRVIAPRNLELEIPADMFGATAPVLAPEFAPATAP